MASTAPSFSATSDDYAKSFLAYAKFSNKEPQRLPLLKRHLGVSNWLKDCTQINKAGQKVVRVLSVGSATGEFDLLVVDMIRDHLALHGDGFTVEFVAVEPIADYVNQYKERVNRDAGYNDVAFQWHQCTFEEYQEAHHIAGDRFHLVYFIHSAYYFQDMAASMSFTFHDLLSDNGCAFVMMSCDDSYVRNIRKKVELILGENNDAPYNSIPELLSLQASHKDFRMELSETRKRMKVGHVFLPESQDGSLLLDFLAHRTKFRASFDGRIVNEILSFIKEMSEVEEGELYLSDTLAVISVFRSAASLQCDQK